MQSDRLKVCIRIKKELAHALDEVTAENAKLRAEVESKAAAITQLLNGGEMSREHFRTEIADLRARLALAEAVIDAFTASQVADNVWESDGRVEKALAAWREGKA